MWCTARIEYEWDRWGCHKNKNKMRIQTKQMKIKCKGKTRVPSARICAKSKNHKKENKQKQTINKRKVKNCDFSI